MSGNIQNKLRQVRKPRVHSTLDVETEGQVKKELPFVMGVMGDFSGDPRKQLPSFAERAFVTIDRDNFDSVMERMTPGLTLKVDNKLSDDGSQIGVDLSFSKLVPRISRPRNTVSSSFDGRRSWSTRKVAPLRCSWR